MTIQYTWLYTWKIQYTWQSAVLTIYDAWAHDFTWLFTCMMQDTWQWALWDKKGVRKKSAHLHCFEPLCWSRVYWNTKRQKLILGSYVDPCIGYEGADPEICEQLVPPKWHHRGRDGEVLWEGKRTSVINISDTIVCWPLTLKRVCGCPVMAVTCPSHWTKPQRT